MKNASKIINSIQNKPQFSKLSKYKRIKRIESIFIPVLQKKVSSFSVFLAGKQEFDNNIQSIKSALNFHMLDKKYQKHHKSQK